MFKEIEFQAKEIISKCLEDIGVKIDIPIEESNKEFGDVSTSICFSLAKTLKKSPKELAEEIAKKAKPFGYIKEIKALNGYINFYIDYEKLCKELFDRIDREDYGREKKNGRKIILEHTSANPDGPLHIGHGRNAIIGDTLARILKFYGFRVETQFYINDMGKQLAIVVFGLRRFKLDKNKKKDHAIAEVYIKANRILEETPELHKEVVQLMRGYEKGKYEKEFKYAVNFCLDGIKQTLRELNIKIDKFVWESEFVRSSKVEKIVKKLKETKYARQNDALYLDLSEFGIDKELFLTRSDGTFLYTTRDIAYHCWKAELGRVIDILGADHKLVANQIKAVMRILGKEEPEIIIYEFISLPEGSMSTRKGKFITLDDLIRESIKRAHEEVNKRRRGEEELKKKIARCIGIGAVRFNIIRVSPEKPLIFRWEDALNFEKQGVTFVLYAHARACRILEKAKLEGNLEEGKLTDNEKRIIKLLAKFPKIIEKSALERKPNIVANYAIELAEAFHRFYRYDRVLNSNRKNFRLKLTKATKKILATCLELLGIEPLEMM